MIFDKTNRLEDVNFSGNKISKISSNMFDRGNTVKKLNFGDNQLNFMNLAFFERARNLQDLTTLLKQKYSH